MGSISSEDDQYDQQSDRGGGGSYCLSADVSESERSIYVFLFAPFVAYCIKRYSFWLYLWFSLGVVGLTLVLVYRLQGFFFGILLGLLVFITFICPYWLTRIQKYKFEINGPWDEAKLCFDINE